MKKQKQYRYKVWVEIERIEVDKDGNEVGEHERGETFVADPDKVGNVDTVEKVLMGQSKLVRFGVSIV